MTISSTPSEVSYAGDGVTVAFPIPFVFDTAADLKVLSTDADGNISTLTTGFSVSGGNGSTGTLTFGTAPASTVDITILDNPEIKQATDYVSNDPFPAESHERALDRLTRICKRLVKQFARTIHTQDGDPITDLTLGSVDNRKGKYLFFNAITGAIEYAANIVTTTLSQSIIGQLLNPQTLAESAASVTPLDNSWQSLLPQRYGGIGDGAHPTEDAAAWAAWRSVMAVSTTKGSQWNIWSREDEKSLGVGFNALKSEVAGTGGTQNTAIGYRAMEASNGSIRNVVIGADSGIAMTAGYQNTIVGAETGQLITIGTRNTFVGNQAGNGTVNENESTAIGNAALFRANAAKNTAVGRNAGYNLTTGASNTVMGYNALLGDAAGATGDFNCVYGYQALTNATTAARNVAMGFQALAIATTAYTNTCIGYGSGSGITTGQYNVIIGGNSGAGIATLSNRVLISDGAGTNRLTFDDTGRATFLNAIVIPSTCFFIGNAANGYRWNSEGSLANLMTLSNAGALRLHTYGSGTLTSDASGNITSVSDERLKNKIRPFERGLSAIRSIKPILHGYTPDSGLDQSKRDYAGFSAQNVLAFIPEAVGTDANGYLSLHDRPVIAALVNAVKELSDRVELLEAA